MMSKFIMILNQVKCPNALKQSGNHLNGDTYFVDIIIRGRFNHECRTMSAFTLSYGLSQLVKQLQYQRCDIEKLNKLIVKRIKKAEIKQRKKIRNTEVLLGERRQLTIDIAQRLQNCRKLNQEIPYKIRNSIRISNFVIVV